MNESYQLKPIGSVSIVESETLIQLDEQYQQGLINLTGFSHLQVLWWAHLTDSAENRQRLVQGKLFKKGPEQLGTFATRSPARPNPIMTSIIQVAEIEYDRGIVHTSFLDADDGTPVLDIKLYFTMERVRDCRVPDWCRHWPSWYEDQMTFDWRKEIESF